MSLHKFFDISSAKRKTEYDVNGNYNNSIPKKQKDNEYDKEKRNRTYQVKWADEFPWVKFNDNEGKMYCTICLKYPEMAGAMACSFISGSSSFHKATLKSHNQSVKHLNCVRHARHHDTSSDIVKTMAQIPEPIDSCHGAMDHMLTNLNEEELSNFDRLFNVAYMIGKHNKPLSDMSIQCELFQKCGVNIGENYRNSIAARKFIIAISEAMKEAIVGNLNNCKFISILSDGSTDQTIVEQETVFLRYVAASGTPTTVFTDIVAVEHGHALGIFEALKQALSTVDLNFEHLSCATEVGPTLISANFDGASVMMGSKSGVISRIREIVPNVLQMHCVAHKLELAVLDAVKDLPSLKNFEDTIKMIYMFYHYSPKRRREVKAIASILDEDLCHFSSIKQVRWVASKERAVQAVMDNLNPVCVHLEEAAVNNRTDEGAKAKGILQRIRTLSFIKMVHIMLDFLPLVMKTSKIFQTEDLLVMEVVPNLEQAILGLVDLKVSGGVNTEKFLKNYNAETRMFGEKIKLVIPGQPIHVDFKTDSDLTTLVESTIKYIEKRFENFNQEPLSLFKVLNFNEWPTDRERLAAFGKEDLAKLLQHFSYCLPADNQRLIQEQFTGLKAHLIKCQSKDLYEVYVSLFHLKPRAFSAIMDIVELMLVISPSTAKCERSFSQMNIIKTNLRNCLKQDILRSLMLLKIEGPTLLEFQPRASVKKWLGTGGTKHVHGHKLTSKNNEMDEEQAAAANKLC